MRPFSRPLLGVLLAGALTLPLSARADDHGESELFGAPAAVDGGSSVDDDAGSTTTDTHDESQMFGAPADEPDAGATSPDAHGESQMFGAPSEPAKKSEGAHGAMEDALFGGGNQTRSDLEAAESGEGAVPSNPLTLGGTLYLRSQVSATDGRPPKDWTLSMPNLVDVYFDGRPNDRVRGFIRARLTYDPTIDPTLVNPLTLTTQDQVNAALDQLWLNFDIARTVFVTAGKQHVKWGTGRFWNPTDYLQPVRLDPLALFDQRTGVTMVKLHVPWEARGWNFYGFALLDGANPVVDTLGRVGAAARAEIVLGSAELGLDAVVQKNRKPRFGADLSTGLGPFDVYAEAGLHGAESGLWERVPGALPAGGLEGLFKLEQPSGIQPQLTVGGDWQVNLTDTDALTVGAEYFYNALGTDDASIYPWLIFKNQFTPFYLGKHYAALFAMVMIPSGPYVNTFTLSNIGNLSDESFISRLDYNITVLQHLLIQVYGDVHYGTEGGEFRFGFDPGAYGISGAPVIPTSLFDVGVNLRIDI